MKVDIYTDGACSKNPGPGGWCAILLSGEHEKVVSGYNKDTTNNRMELFAVIEGLRQLKKPCEVEVFSDSSYVVNAFLDGWTKNWTKNNWKTSTKEKVKNDDLWRLLLLEIDKQKIVNFNKVKGHSDNVYNNKCDMIAVEEIKKVKAENEKQE